MHIRTRFKRPYSSVPIEYAQCSLDSNFNAPLHAHTKLDWIELNSTQDLERSWVDHLSTQEKHLTLVKKPVRKCLEYDPMLHLQTLECMATIIISQYNFLYIHKGFKLCMPLHSHEFLHHDQNLTFQLALHS